MEWESNSVPAVRTAVSAARSPGIDVSLTAAATADSPAVTAAVAGRAPVSPAAFSQCFLKFARGVCTPEKTQLSGWPATWCGGIGARVGMQG